MENNTIFSFEQMEEAINQMSDKLNKRREKMGHINIVVAGKTGVGKSTLINKIFGEELTRTGTGKPVTEGIKEISKEGYPLRIYDTVGLELGKTEQNQSRNGIINLIKEKNKTQDVDQMIHCVWYCVLGESSRLEDEEEKFINKLAETFDNIPIVLVITKAATSLSKELQKDIESRNLKTAKTIRVLATDCEIDEDYVKKAYGCDELVDFVSENVPKVAQGAFIAAQKISLTKKREKAQAVVGTAAATAAAEGFIPIPFSDAIALVPTQMGMIASITITYGLNLQKSTMTAVLMSLLGTSTVTIAGKTIASALLKLIPVVGNVASGVINGATASVLTIALGETYILIMEKLISGEMTEADLRDGGKMEEFKKIFIEKFKAKNKK